MAYDAELNGTGKVVSSGSLGWGIELRPMEHCQAAVEAAKG